MEPTIDLDGYRHVYTAVGEPTYPAVIMLHGWNSYRGMWDSTIDVLQADYYCVALDLLGFGDSDKTSHADFSIEAQSKRVIAFVDALGIDEFILIGHSMGGQIGIYIASKLAPERVVRLIDVAGVLTGKIKWQPKLFTPMIHLAYYLPFLVTVSRQLVRIPLIAKLGFHSLFYDVFAVPYAEWDGDRRVSVQAGSHVASSMALQALQSENLSANLADISAPTLIIFGQQDGLVPLSEARLAHTEIADSQLIIYDTCGHFPMYERKADYLDAVCQFLQQSQLDIASATVPINR
jgi:pimeloyl-ACP methyl ester carboxylesterase